MGRALVLVVFLFNALWSSCQELHLIEPTPGICYDVYRRNQPIFLTKHRRACMRILPNFNNCLGLKTQNNETIIVDCKEKSVEATEEDTKGISNSTDANPKRNTKQNKEENISRSVKNSSGCYKMIKPDGTEGTVCQKLDRAKGCEIISTPSSLYVEVFCYPLEKLGNTIFLKKLKASKT